MGMMKEDADKIMVVGIAILILGFLLMNFKIMDWGLPITVLGLMLAVMPLMGGRVFRNSAEVEAYRKAKLEEQARIDAHREDGYEPPRR